MNPLTGEDMDHRLAEALPKQPFYVLDGNSPEGIAKREELRKKTDELSIAERVTVILRSIEVMNK